MRGLKVGSGSGDSRTGVRRVCGEVREPHRSIHINIIDNRPPPGETATPNRENTCVPLDCRRFLRNRWFRRVTRASGVAVSRTGDFGDIADNRDAHPENAGMIVASVPVGWPQLHWPYGFCRLCVHLKRRQQSNFLFREAPGLVREPGNVSRRGAEIAESDQESLSGLCASA